jgi:hypothetical protein
MRIILKGLKNYKNQGVTENRLVFLAVSERFTRTNARVWTPSVRSGEYGGAGRRARVGLS